MSGAASSVVNLERMRPGFDDPVMGAQALFRQILEATARPGRVEILATAPEGPMPGVRALGGVGLCLLDFETPIHMVGALAEGDFSGWLRFHCGCPLVADPAAAAFVFALAGQTPHLAGLNTGDPKYPERAATLVLACEGLEGGPALSLSGPGVNGAARIAPRGLPDWFWAEREALCAEPPLGLDVILTCDAALIAVPRTTRCTRL